MVIREACSNTLDFYLGCINEGQLEIKCGYLKLMGEINPKVSNLPTIERGIENYDHYIYEYLWTLCLTGDIERPSGKFEKWTDKLAKKDAILVQVFFHTEDTKYSVRAITGTIKPPFMIKKNIKDFLGDKWMKFTGTTIQSFGDYVKLPLAKQIGSEITNAMAQFDKDSAPSSYSYPWYSKVIATYEREEEKLKQLDGVEWCIDRRAFINLGNRLEGAMGLIFVESSDKGKEGLNLEVRAKISFNDDYEIWMPFNPNLQNPKTENRLHLTIKPTKSKQITDGWW
ncbi:MAG: hypothetical protein JW724_02610 [Candidatus Altiarchaeota archaeon]|nr:hypothetical protein [Candidatus Altiarchaeota archaeon]